MRFSECEAHLKQMCSGDGEIRTLDPLLARQVLSQLSYTPIAVDTTAQSSLALDFTKCLLHTNV